MRIRRIRKSDCRKDFETGNAKFDYDEHGKKLDLSFYFERNRRDYECYVLEDKSEILGILCIQKQEDCLYLSRIGVKKGHSRKGYGTRLLIVALEKTKEFDKRKLTCKAHKDVWEFLESMGFKKLYEYEHPHWGLSALMELKLG
jgi:N-acetylglutamate synthase-like GNAT family acetyltransferase